MGSTPKHEMDATDVSHSWRLFSSLAGYRAAFLGNDLFAGLTLAAIAIPEQMATAGLGGFPPHLGFFAFLAGSLAFALFGGNRFLSSGADSTITPIFAGGLAVLAAFGDPHYLVLASALAVMVGLIVLAAGVFRLGWIADLLSIPVTTGFLAGISLHIVVSQLPVVLGLPAPSGSMIERLVAIARHLSATNPWTLVIAIGVLGIIVISEWWDRRIPGALIGLLLASIAVAGFGLHARGVVVLGNVAATWPHFSMPEVPASRVASLITLSLIISIVVMVQTAATTRSFPSSSNAPPDVDRDFVGVGVGSMLSGLLGAFPVNASPPRTAAVAETGGRSQLAALVAVAIILLLLAFGSALLGQIPTAALGGVLLFVAGRIIRLRQIVTIYRQSLGEFLLIVATVVALVALPIEQGVGIGIALSLVHGLWSTSRAQVLVYERVPGTSIWWPASATMSGERQSGVLVVGFQAPLSFLNAYRFRRDMLQNLQSAGRPIGAVILEATGIVEIDFTAAQILMDLVRRYRAKGVVFAMARLESVRAQAAMQRFGITDVLGEGRQFQSVEEGIHALGRKAQSNADEER